MRLGSRTFRRFFRREFSARALGVSLAGFILVQWAILASHDQDALVPFQVERLIAASVLADAAGKVRPDWERQFAQLTRSGLWRQTRIQCESAERLGFFPKDVYSSWALAAHWFGEENEAIRLAEQVSPVDAIERLILALIRNEEPAYEDLVAANDSFRAGSDDWRTSYLLAQLTPDNSHLRDWMTELGARSYRRTLIQSFAFWTLFATGLIAAVWLLVSRKKVWLPARRHFRLPSRWPLSTVLTIFFGGLTIGMVLSIASGFLAFFGPESQAVVFILAYLLFLGFPALLLSATLTPSFRGTGRLFGLRDLPVSTKSIVLAGLALSFVLWSFSMALEWLWRDLRISDLRGWLRFEALDSHLGFAATLVAAGIIAPLFEELIFRGFLFRALKNPLSPLISAALSSAMFATYHWYSLAGWITVFLIGLLFCGMAQWSRSLWPGILAHSLFNLVMMWAVWANFSFA